MQATLALQPDNTIHFQINEETLAGRLTRSGFLAHRALHLPTERLVGISRRIGGLLGQQTGHIGQGDRATYLLATADEREKIE
ncbi:hypothetical protein SAMD00023378_4053 [Ralstonia sp. NT80]|nr:hypothetical protein SAMD00023378_4053 [Ralstonia sp. NT80]